MRSTKRWAAISAGLLLSTTLAACSGGGGGGADVEADPAQALSDAVEALSDYDGIEMTLSIDGDRDAIMASDDALDETTADLLLDSALVLRAAGEDEADAQAEFVVDLAGQQAVEVRVLPDQQFFLRIDLDAIAGVVDDPAFTSGIDEAVVAAEQFGMGELATTIRDGEWVELTGTEQLAELAGGAAATDEEPSEEEVEDVREQMVDSLQDFLDEDVTMTYVGEEDAGERITATTTQADLVELFDEFAEIAGDLSGVDPDALGEGMPEGEASDTPVELDFWIADGRLSQLGYDLSQIEGEESAPEGTFVLAGLAEFDGSVEAPSDATEIDLFGIIGQMFGGGMGGMPSDLGGMDEMEDGAGADAGQDPAGGLDAECLTQDEFDQLTGGDPDVEADMETALEMGIIELCEQ